MEHSPASQGEAPPLTAVQQLGEFAAMQGLDSGSYLPDWMQDIYDLLLQHGAERETIGRRLGMTSVAEVLRMESTIMERIIRTGDFDDLETLQTFRQTHAAEAEQLAGAEPFLTRPERVILPDPSEIQSQADASKRRSRSPAPPAKTASRKARRSSVAKDPDEVFYNPTIKLFHRLLTEREMDPSQLLKSYPGRQTVYRFITQTSFTDEQIREKGRYSPRIFRTLQKGIITVLFDAAPHILGFSQPPIELAEITWRQHERVETLRQLGVWAAERQIVITGILDPRSQEVFDLLINPQLKIGEIREQLGLNPTQLSVLGKGILRQLSEKLRLGAWDLEELRQRVNEILKTKAGKPPPGTDNDAFSVTPRDTIRQIHGILTAHDVDPLTILADDPACLLAYPLVVDDRLTLSEIAAALHRSRAYFVKGQKILIDRLVEGAPHILRFTPAEEGAKVLRASVPWKAGERREVIRLIDQKLSAAGIDPASMLTPNMLPLYRLLTTTQADHEEITRQLGCHESYMAVVSKRIIERLSKKSPEGMFTLEELRYTATFKLLGLTPSPSMLAAFAKSRSMPQATPPQPSESSAESALSRPAALQPEELCRKLAAPVITVEAPEELEFYEETVIERRTDPELGKRWKRNEVRAALHNTKAVLEDRGINPRDLLASKPAWQAAYDLFTTPRLQGAELQERLGFTTGGQVSRLARDILEFLVAVTPASALDVKLLRETAQHIRPPAAAMPPSSDAPPVSPVVPPSLNDERWRPGELRGMLQKIGDVLSAYKIDAAEVLGADTSLHEVYSLLLNPALTATQISERLHYNQSAQISQTARRILRKFVDRIPPEILRFEELRKAVAAQLPAPSPKPSKNGFSLQLNSLLNQKYPNNRTLAVQQLAEQCEHHTASIWRYLRGAALPSASVFQAILAHFQLSPEEMAEFTDIYRRECRARREAKTPGRR